MIGWADARRAVEEYVATKVPTVLPGLPIFYENMTRPSKSGSPAAEWVGVSVSEQASAFTSTGPNPLMQVSGLVIVQVFTPLHGGQSARRSAVILEAIATLFVGASISAGTSGRLSFRRPPYHAPAQPSDGWWQDNLIAPYTRSKTVPIAAAWTP